MLGEFVFFPRPSRPKGWLIAGNLNKITDPSRGLCVYINVNGTFPTLRQKQGVYTHVDVFVGGIHSQNGVCLVGDCLRENHGIHHHPTNM